MCALYYHVLPLLKLLLLLLLQWFNALQDSVGAYLGEPVKER